MGDKLYNNHSQFRVRPNEIVKVEKGVVIEQSVTLYVNGQSWLTFMCLPTDLDALAVGFLFNEGIIDQESDIRLVEVHPSGQMVEVWLSKDVKKPEQWKITSGCAGGTTIARNESNNLVINNDKVISAQQIFDFGKKIFEEQNLYQEVGGVHASALADGGDLILVCEDIGRHNTLDKIAGKILLEKMIILNPVLISSGRISSEMIQKAGRMKVPIVISRTSPTSLSINLAKEFGITLIGYARGKQFNIYTHPHRIIEYNQTRNIVA